MAEVATLKTPAETALADLFARSKSLLPGDARSREDAFHRFAEKGLPHRRVEEWKYTDLRALMREIAPLAEKPSEAGVARALSVESVFAAAEPATIAFVDGHLATADAMPAGVTAVPLAVALAQGHPLLSKLGAVSDAEGNAAYALNAAFMTDGVVLHVTGAVDRRVALRFVTAGAQPVATATRVLVVVEPGAAISLLETHESPHGVAHQPNSVVEFVVGDRAKVAHVRLNANGDKALALSTLTAHLGGEVAFGSRNVVAGSAVSRHQVWMTFAGADSRGAVRGATMLSGDQHADTTLVVNHKATGCESRELFKHAIDGRGTGVFQGRINVARGAQKTDGQMMSAAVLLSEEGTMNNKPELEIFADDVQCAHGATCGELDDDLLFYLMARGLPRPEAEALLIESFLGEAVEEGLDDEVVGEALMGVVEAWLAARG
ncbi:Fe-S cluster assembly protein SufD [Salinarimonas rosea]|uniref:Fe-S cluster assembly protein SufD n=1 Tax=Salinarimonas rosea TaxID=552063 RepID=UPI000419BED7|nr:Fe-S cluster assembly protein SufD [Salinarimonas rosea]